MIPTRKIKLPERQNGLRFQLNRRFETEQEMKDFVESNHKGAIIKQFWPVQMLACVIEEPTKKS
jgi:hypothetical protein